MKKVIGLFVASVLMCGNAVALDYTQEGKVIPQGYTGPGFSVEEAEFLGASLGVFTILAFTDWPTGKVPTIAAGAATVLGYGAYRKEHYDLVNGIPSAKLTKVAHMESGLVGELLE